LPAAARNARHNACHGQQQPSTPHTQQTAEQLRRLQCGPLTEGWRAAMNPQLVGVPHASGQPNDGGMTTVEQNKAIIREFIDRLFTKGDLGAVDDLLAEDFVNHNPPFGASSDREGMRGAGAMFRAAFPDWHSDLGLLIGEGDLVVEQFTASGKQRGEIMGVPATGRTVTLPGIQIFRVRNGRIVERWGRLDDLGLLSQLGLVNQP
jgi:steroid delta-isomerase-like uncharacterized protein